MPFERLQIISRLDSETARSIAARTGLILLLTLCASWLLSCGAPEPTPSDENVVATSVADDLPNGLLLALAVLDKNEDGSPKPLPARLGIIRRQGGEWVYSTLDDPDSNVFHKAMVYSPREGESGILTLGGTGAYVKLWHADGSQETLWHADFGGKFSRMRDAEVADLDGDGDRDIAIATHDQGVVAVIWAEDDGYRVEEIDRTTEWPFVHEIEIGDLDGDGVPEVYATPSEPNRLDGTAQHGEVVRYVPGKGEGRAIVADLGDRHAKEILVRDVDGDGRDELYVSVEAVSGGRLEIRRFDAGTDPTGGETIAELEDSQCRFLTAGDIDGDGSLEIVAAAMKSGLWLLRPSGVAGTRWPATLIDAESGGFEHAAILTDLDRDGTDELYVASDNDDEVGRYTFEDGEWQHEVLVMHLDDLGRFTWNIMPAPVELLPEAGSD